MKDLIVSLGKYRIQSCMSIGRSVLLVSRDEPNDAVLVLVDFSCKMHAMHRTHRSTTSCYQRGVVKMHHTCRLEAFPAWRRESQPVFVCRVHWSSKACAKFLLADTVLIILLILCEFPVSRSSSASSKWQVVILWLKSVVLDYFHMSEGKPTPGRR